MEGDGECKVTIRQMNTAECSVKNSFFCKFSQEMSDYAGNLRQLCKLLRNSGPIWRCIAVDLQLSVA
jgi:hypothetical protein